MLPPRPGDQTELDVAVWRQPVEIDTYLPELPNHYPAYLDRRVYQGSSGRVYPLPFFERIAVEKRPRAWDAIHLENRWLRLMVLPELGGRIHVAQDRSNGHDLFYRNEVIKPALIGLTGPWIAGGVEFNWPQHHRPGTFLPTDVSIERDESGVVTVWCSEHDPFTRMKGMHGICLHPDRAIVETRARLHNRTDETQTFLWWANAAVSAHADYQSFFPPDVTMVADHARRAVTAYPAADRSYYGVDYPERRNVTTTSPSGKTVSGDRIDWYRNIPVPTSYMCLASRGEFFGGYDHSAEAGFIHVADRQVSVGKKQWTWGAAPFGRAWDRNLSDDGSAYVELMAGVFSDNQPDFAHIAPGETKVFSQFWYPFRGIGPAQQASVEAATRLEWTSDAVRVHLAVTRDRPKAQIEVRDRTGQLLAARTTSVAPERPVHFDLPLPDTVGPTELTLLVHDDEEELLHLDTASAPPSTARPAVAPELPVEVASVDELYRIGLHLAQYRHATRSPVPYWHEARRRDPGHPGSCVELAALAHQRGLHADAEELLRTAISRLTGLNSNPINTRAYYLLGLALVRMGRPVDAYDAFGRASWSRAWRAPAGFQMALLDARAGRHGRARQRLDDVLRCEPEHLRARCLQILQLRHLGSTEAAEDEVQRQLSVDPLDWWLRDLAGDDLTCDPQTCVDVALEYKRAGELDEALRVFDHAWRNEHHPVLGAPTVRPLVALYRADLLATLGRHEEARVELRRAATVDGQYCFPSRLDDAELLQAVVADDRVDQADLDRQMKISVIARANAMLGHWLYAHGRRREAVTHWRAAVEGDPTDSVSWRNLGLAAYNEGGDAEEAARCYQAARAAAPDDSRLLFEADCLARRRGVPPRVRLRAMLDHRELVAQRDDLTVELAHLLVTDGRSTQARALLVEREFQPWEGGEGEALRAWDRVHVSLAREALAAQDPLRALGFVDAALSPPPSLGEARHPLEGPSALMLLRGDCLARLDRMDEARESWRSAASPAVVASGSGGAATIAAVAALRRLGQHDEAADLVVGMRDHCERLSTTTPEIDYFATSLPELLLFNEDLEVARDREVAVLEVQLDLADGHLSRATESLTHVLDQDPNNVAIIDIAARMQGDAVGWDDGIAVDQLTAPAPEGASHR